MMNETELLHRAIEIAVEGHRTHPTKGEPLYVLHPLRVMLAQKSITAMIVGILHDVVEDCEEWTFDRLAEEGFPESVTEPLRLVTKLSDDEDYDAFIARAAPHPIARAVKLADLEDTWTPPASANSPRKTTNASRNTKKPTPGS